MHRRRSAQPSLANSQEQHSSADLRGHAVQQHHCRQQATIIHQIGSQLVFSTPLSTQQHLRSGTSFTATDNHKRSVQINMPSQLVFSTCSQRHQFYSHRQPQTLCADKHALTAGLLHLARRAQSTNARVSKLPHTKSNHISNATLSSITSTHSWSSPPGRLPQRNTSLTNTLLSTQPNHISIAKFVVN